MMEPAEALPKARLLTALAFALLLSGAGVAAPDSNGAESTPRYGGEHRDDCVWVDPWVWPPAWGYNLDHCTEPQLA